MIRQGIISAWTASLNAKGQRVSYPHYCQQRQHLEHFHRAQSHQTQPVPLLQLFQLHPVHYPQMSRPCWLKAGFKHDKQTTFHRGSEFLSQTRVIHQGFGMVTTKTEDKARCGQSSSVSFSSLSREMTPTGRIYNSHMSCTAPRASIALQNVYQCFGDVGGPSGTSLADCLALHKF